jgi:probable rRNA maturation factor
VKVNLFVNSSHAPKLPRGSVGALIREIVRDEKKNADSINVVLVDDDYLLDVNKKFLKHDYRTDVISFDLNGDGDIDGEIYVSVDRAMVQSRRYKVPLEKEVLRLIVHGTLHLTGWEDGTRSEKLRMRRRENVFIERFFAARRRA